MHIVENGVARLVVRDRTSWVSWVCIAAAAANGVGLAATHDLRFLVPGLLFAAFGAAFLRASDVVFDKARRLCRVRRRDVGRVTFREIPFQDIVDVRVETASVS